MKIMKMKKLALATTLALTFNFAHAEWHALVVGMNDYEAGGFKDLAGAVNDAKDIEKALIERGVQPKVMLNKKATYTEITAWWENTIKNASAGDTILFTVSGHGAKENEHFPGTDNAGGINNNSKDETIMLSGYKDKGEASKERIVDQELLGWAKQATDKGARVILVTDVCFGGGMTRSTLAGVNMGDKRFAVRGGENIEPEDKSKRGTIEDAQLSVYSDKFHHNLFMVTPYNDEEQPVAEANINNEARGVASYLFANLLRTKDNNATGLTLEKIDTYLQKESRAITENIQTVLIHPDETETKDIVIFDNAPTDFVQPSPPLPTIFVAGETSDLADDSNYLLTDDTPNATYRWDRNKATVDKSSIGVVAYDINNESDLLSFLVNEKMISDLRRANITNILGNIVPENSQDIDKPSATVFTKGNNVDIYTALDDKYAHLLLVNIPSKGAPQLLGYIPTNKLQAVVNAKKLTHKVTSSTVVPPYGTDHLLLIALTDKGMAHDTFFKKMTALGAKLSVKDREKLVKRLNAMPKTDIALGVVTFATAQ